MFRSARELTEAALEESNINYTPAPDETFINPLAGLSPRNWGDVNSGYVDDRAVQKMREGDMARELARITEEALDVAEEREDADLSDERMRAGAVFGIAETHGRGAYSEEYVETALEEDGWEILKEGDDDSPEAPDGYDDWENAGWDVVARDPSGEIHKIQVKASCDPKRYRRRKLYNKKPITDVAWVKVSERSDGRKCLKWEWIDE